MSEVKRKVSGDEMTFIALRRKENAAASASMNEEGFSQRTALLLLNTRLVDFNQTIFKLIVDKATKKE